MDIKCYWCGRLCDVESEEATLWHGENKINSSDVSSDVSLPPYGDFPKFDKKAANAVLRSMYEGAIWLCPTCQKDPAATASVDAHLNSKKGTRIQCLPYLFSP